MIMSPFAPYMVEAVRKIQDLPIDIICPAHGPILRQDPWETVSRFENWAKACLYDNDPKKVFIGYVSAYGNTGKIAEVLAAEIRSSGLDVTLMEVSQSPLADVVAEIDRCDALLLGSPTINRGRPQTCVGCVGQHIRPEEQSQVGGSLRFLRMEREAVGMITDRFKSLGLQVVEPGFRTKFVPDASALAEAAEYGRLFAETVIKAAAKKG